MGCAYFQNSLTSSKVLSKDLLDFSKEAIFSLRNTFYTTKLFFQVFLQTENCSFEIGACSVANALE
jgi:hypothetical protein